MKGPPVNFYKKGFKGCYALDQLDKIPIKKDDNIVSFIYNLDPISKPGSHWCAVYIDKKYSKSVEYYDPFGEPAPKRFMEDISIIIEKMKPSTYLKFKENSIQMQRLNSTSCGFFSLKFFFLQ